MKTNKYFFSVMGFITGTVFGISVFLFLSFTNGPAAPAQGSGVVAITSADAHTCFTKYLSGAVSYNQVIKGINIDRTQLEAMNSISGENPALPGFRIYFGKDNTGRSVAIVVGVDSMGKDAVKNTIFNTDAPKFSPCPPICDVSSPIIFGN
ncbi:MAG: hypothetical protein WCK34_08260 [Bacteroidota bacterium]